MFQEAKIVQTVVIAPTYTIRRYQRLLRDHWQALQQLGMMPHARRFELCAVVICAGICGLTCAG